jgi:hypothetical protein
MAKHQHMMIEMSLVDATKQHVVQRLRQVQAEYLCAQRRVEGIEAHCGQSGSSDGFQCGCLHCFSSFIE